MTQTNKPMTDTTLYDIIIEHELDFIEATMLANVVFDANSGRNRMSGAIAATYYQMLNYCEEFNYSRRGYIKPIKVEAIAQRLQKAYGMTRNQTKLCEMLLSWDDANDFANMTDFIEHHSMIGKGVFDKNDSIGALWRYCIEYGLLYFAGVMMYDLLDTRTDLKEYESVNSNFHNLCIQFQKAKPDTRRYPDPVVLMGHPVFELPWVSPKLAAVFNSLANLRTMDDIKAVVELINIEKDAYIDRVQSIVNESTIDGKGIVVNGMPILAIDSPPVPTDY